MEPKDLERLGLTKNETAVFMALLKLGCVSVGPIINLTKFHRNIVYDNLNNLIERGLVSFVIKANRKHFEIASPKALNNLIEEEKKNIAIKEKTAKKIIEEISEIKKLEKQKATIYKGVKGVMSALESQLQKGREIVGFGATAKLVEKVHYFYRYFFPRFHKKRVSLKIPMRAIFSSDNKKRGKEMKKMTSLLQVKYIPKEFSFPISLTTTGNKTLIITWSEEPYAFEIESKDVAKSMKAYFEALWKIAKN